MIVPHQALSYHTAAHLHNKPQYPWYKRPPVPPSKPTITHYIPQSSRCSSQTSLPSSPLPSLSPWPRRSSVVRNAVTQSIRATPTITIQTARQTMSRHWKRTLSNSRSAYLAHSYNSNVSVYIGAKQQVVSSGSGTRSNTARNVMPRIMRAIRTQTTRSAPQSILRT